jgi:hypothetical protein
MALNSPPLKLYDCASFALDDINEFAKGQGYTVSKFRSKTDKQSPPTVRKMRPRCAKGNSFKKIARKRLTCKVLAVVFYRLTGGREALPFHEDFTEGSFGGITSHGGVRPAVIDRD